jgi:hypothetical protein
MARMCWDFLHSWPASRLRGVGDDNKLISRDGNEDGSASWQVDGLSRKDDLRCGYSVCEMMRLLGRGKMKKQTLYMASIFNDMHEAILSCMILDLQFTFIPRKTTIQHRVCSAHDDGRRCPGEVGNSGLTCVNLMGSAREVASPTTTTFCPAQSTYLHSTTTSSHPTKTLLTSISI